MRVVLHVGLPKTGTTYLQRILAENRDRLRERGVLHPFLRPGAMFEAAVEIRGSAAKFGLDAAAIRGTWEQLCERARSFDGTTVISHEVLAGATPEQIGAALAPLTGLDVEVIVTARDLGRQATAHWQEELKLGDTTTFAGLERDQLRADTGRDAGPDAGGVRPHFWHAQDFADALRRWTEPLPPQQGHLVVCPAPGAEPSLLWRRFAEAAGIDDTAVPPAALAAAEPVNRSLGAEDAALVRAVNERVAGRLPVAERHRVVKREWAEGVLAGRPGTPLRAPAALADVLGPVTERWLAEVVARGHRVHGDPVDLDPVLADPDEPPPDRAVAADVDPDAVADGLVARASQGSGTPAADTRGRGALRSLTARLRARDR